MATFAVRTGSAAAALVAFFALSCGPSREDRASGARESRSAVISDQVHNHGVPGFFWLPPMAPTTAYGEFKPGLAPEVVIERLPVGSSPPVATFTAAEVRTDGESHYKVNWDTKASSLDPTVMYRIRIVLGWFELGYADVDVVSSGSELRNVTSGEYIPLLDGRTLPIKFRIEPAAMPCVDRGPCTAKDQCHVAGTCDPFTGTCSDPEKPSGSSCDDGDLCTQTDTCQSGACTGSNPLVCAAQDQCHDAGTCEPSTGACSNPEKPNDTACDDASLCTQTDTCQAGSCTGSDPVVCTAQDQCHDAGTCEPLTGMCPDPEKPNGTACNDENACTQSDTCQAGACTGANPVVCTASDQCHDAGTCDPSSGFCSNPSRADGSACSDGALCTRTDTCQAGACIGSNPVVCPEPDQCHDAGACEPSTGLCSNPSKADGTTCSDGSFCTVADACAAGTCRGAEITCDDQDACTQNGCDPGTVGADGVTGCVYVPDKTLAGCEVPAPPATVSIVGLSAATEGFFANQRLNFAIKLAATADRPEYDVEFLLFPVTSPDDPNEYPGVPLGTWHIPLVTTGEKDYWVELEIPETLQPGAWEIAVHEYPTGEEFFPPEDEPNPLVLVVEAAPELPVLDVTALVVGQAALLVDPDSTVPEDPTVYRDAPFAADLELVAQNYGATQVPVTAQLSWNGQPVPLRIWDPAQAQWVETLVLDALDADAPRGVFLELALAESDAERIRADLGPEPMAAQVVVTVNGDGSVPEAECVVDDPDAPVNCRHAALATALVYAAPPAPPEEAAPFAMALAATSNTAPLRYEKSWSKSIGNDWARAGIAFSGFAQLSKDGYEASARGNVPMRLLGLPEFQFVDATASADALVDGSTSVGVLVQAVGINVYSRSYTGNPAQWDLGKEFPFVQKEKSFQKTVIVYIVPVTFKLGASGELGLQGNISATFVPGPADVASLTLSGGPYARADGFGEGAVGVAFLSAGARVTLTLIDANLTAAATGSLTLTKRLDNGRPLEITGGLNERLSYATSFMNGRVGLVVTYPTLKWCRVWRFRFPCGFRSVTKEAVLASWPGYSYGGDILNLSQDLFSIDVCTPTVLCGARCGPIDNGCREEVCTCPAGQTCNSESVCVSTGFAYAGLYDVQHRWGGEFGTWWDETGDSRAQDIVVHADRRVFRGGVPIVNPTVGVNTVSWSMADGNVTDGNVTFLDGSTNTFIWGPAGRSGVLFEGANPRGIRFPGEGWLDFRGVRICVPTATCEAGCGPMFDGCATVDCGGCPAGQYCASGTVGPNVCTDGTAPYMVGTYTTGTKWGGWSGTWNPGSDLRITPAGEIFKGGIRIANPTMVGGKTPGLYHSWTASCASCHGPDYPRPTVSWTTAGGNDSSAAVTFTEGSANEYYWPGGQGGWLFEGWIQYPGDGAVDYRGLKQ